MAALNLDDKLFDRLLSEAGSSPRKRVHYNIHQDHSEPVQRLCIALKNGTYIRPHCHFDIEEWEMIIALRGAVVMLIFNLDGTIENRIALSPATADCGVELKPGTWHMLFPVDSEAIIFEVKQGPFRPKQKNDFATWSPEDTSEEVEEFLMWAKHAVVGDNFRIK